MTPPPSGGSVLSVRDLTMTFPGTRALDGLNLDLYGGQVHALVGQNGSGKSTLIKILAGYYVPTKDSRVEVSGRPLQFGSAEESRMSGLRFVHQDLGLIPVLSTIENLALTNGYDTSVGRPISWRKQRGRAEEALRRLGYDFDVTAPLSSLTPAERTGVAVARALDGWESGARVLVLDEPTAALPKPECEQLFRVIKRVKDSGVAVLYVSHHLEEVLRISDQVTALRGGRLVATKPRSELGHDGLIELIVGHGVTATIPSPRIPDGSQVLLRTSALTGSRLHGLDLEVRAGEVVGIAGLAGSGREQVASLIFGSGPREGEVVVNEQSLRPGSPVHSVRAGLALLPADRGADGILAGMAVRENLVISSLRRARLRKPLRVRAERSDSMRWLDRLSVSPRATEIPVAALSGGNQQKVLIAKWLRTAPRVLLLDDPTQGVDVGSRAEIYRELLAAAAQGCGVVVCSSDSRELEQLCQRVIVLVGGRVAAVLTGPEIRAESIDAWCLSTSVPSPLLEEALL